MSLYYNIIDSARRILCRIQYSKNIPVTHNNFRREFQRYILSRISRMKRKSLIPNLSVLIFVQQNSYDECRVSTLKVIKDVSPMVQDFYLRMKGFSDIREESNGTMVGRVLNFFSSRRIGTPPPPHPQASPDSDEG